MTIDRLGSVDPLSRAGKTEKTVRPQQVNSKDSVNVSDEARNKAEFYTALEIARNTPDVRADKVAEMKKKLEDPSYINDVLLDKVAQKILDSFEV